MENQQNNINPIEDNALGQDRPTRIQNIKKIQKNRPPDFKYSTFVSKTEQIKLDVYLIEISLPIYRLKNTRTEFQQESYLRLNPELDNGFFSDDPESREALKVQHGLLFSEATEDSESNHYEIFKKTPYDQSQPTIINLREFN